MRIEELDFRLRIRQAKQEGHHPKSKSMNIRIERLNPSLIETYFKFKKTCGYDWCYCTAWMSASWEEFGKRSANENFLIRDTLFSVGHFDGFLIFNDEKVIGWVQVTQIKNLRRLLDEYKMQDFKEDWAITCWAIDEKLHMKGVATETLPMILKFLKEQKAKRVFAFPFRREHDFWSGPENLYKRAKFEVHKDDPENPIFTKTI